MEGRLQTCLSKDARVGSGSFRPELRVKTCLCSANYEFHMVGLEPVEGRPAFVVDIEPRRHERSVCSQAVSGLMRTTMRS